MNDSNDKNITPDERALFRSEMSFVKPMHHNHSTIVLDTPARTPSITIKKPIQSQPAINQRDSYSSDKTTLALHHSQPTISGETTIQFQRTGLQRKLLIQFRQGKLPIHATLDLHKHTSEEAIAATSHFLIHCQQHSYRFVRIIHGKGLCSSPDAPIIKNLLNRYLRAHPGVLAFHSSKAKHGGTGALYVMVKLLNN